LPSIAAKVSYCARLTIAINRLASGGCMASPAIVFNTTWFHCIDTSALSRCPAA